MEAQTFVPREFYCPITGDLMVDPVSDPNGNSYEKDSIIKWLSKNETNKTLNNLTCTHFIF